MYVNGRNRWRNESARHGMEPFKNFTGLVAPLDRSNVDTDQIIPKQFLKAVVRSGLARGLFYDWRQRADGQFVLQQPRFQKSTILVARANFGCGSSREHAVGPPGLRVSGADCPQFRRYLQEQLSQEWAADRGPRARGNRRNFRGHQAA